MTDSKVEAGTGLTREDPKEIEYEEQWMHSEDDLEGTKLTSDRASLPGTSYPDKEFEKNFDIDLDKFKPTEPAITQE